MVRAYQRMDVAAVDLQACPEWCTCDKCRHRAAALHIRRLLWGRWLYTHGNVREDIPQRDPRLLFARWLVETGRVNEWNVAHDPMPLPERLHRAWERTR